MTLKRRLIWLLKWLLNTVWNLSLFWVFMLIILGMSDLVGTICIHNPEDKQSQEVAPVYGDPLAIESEVPFHFYNILRYF